MSNDSLEQEQSPESLDGESGSEEMKGDEPQQILGGADTNNGQLAQSDGDPTLQKPMPRAEDYDFFLNVRHREHKEPNENDEPTEH